VQNSAMTMYVAVRSVYLLRDKLLCENVS